MCLGKIVIKDQNKLEGTPGAGGGRKKLLLEGGKR